MERPLRMHPPPMSSPTSSVGSRRTTSPGRRRSWAEDDHARSTPAEPTTEIAPSPEERAAPPTTFMRPPPLAPYVLPEDRYIVRRGDGYAQDGQSPPQINGHHYQAPLPPIHRPAKRSVQDMMAMAQRPLAPGADNRRSRPSSSSSSDRPYSRESNRPSSGGSHPHPPPLLTSVSFPPPSYHATSVRQPQHSSHSSPRGRDDRRLPLLDPEAAQTLHGRERKRSNSNGSNQSGGASGKEVRPISRESVDSVATPPSSLTGLQGDPSNPQLTLQRKRRSRALMTTMQLSALNKLWKTVKFPSATEREKLGAEIGLTARQVQVWFQNQRQKYRKQLEEGIPEGSNPADYEELSKSPRARRISDDNDDRVSQWAASSNSTSLSSNSFQSRQAGPLSRISEATHNFVYDARMSMHDQSPRSESEAKPILWDDGGRPYAGETRDKGYKDRPYTAELRERPYTPDMRDRPYTADTRDRPYASAALDRPYSTHGRSRPLTTETQDRPYTTASRDRPFTMESRERPYTMGTRERPFSADERTLSYPDRRPESQQSDASSLMYRRSTLSSQFPSLMTPGPSTPYSPPSSAPPSRSSWATLPAQTAQTPPYVDDSKSTSPHMPSHLPDSLKAIALTRPLDQTIKLPSLENAIGENENDLPRFGDLFGRNVDQ
ncbi:hypothetical protein P7C73_g5847, partial [Tremellales sp. Uapishka_1]